MLYGMASLMIFFGIFIASLGGFAQGPPILSFLFMLFGVILGVAGLSIISIRLKKTGIEHIFKPGTPGNILWFYIYKDGQVRITPSMRVGEGLLYGDELDATIPDTKKYQLADHQIRFVAEELGYSVDMGLARYAKVLKSKYGFANLQELRNRLFGLIKDKSVTLESTEFKASSAMQLKMLRQKVKELESKVVTQPTNNTYPQLRSR